MSFLVNQLLHNENMERSYFMEPLNTTISNNTVKKRSFSDTSSFKEICTLLSCPNIDQSNVEALNKILNNRLKSPLERNVESFTLKEYEDSKNSESPLSTQVGGGHYKNFKIQPLEFTMANNLDFIQGNIIKYACRHKDKNGVEDLKKVIHYAQLAIELQYSKDADNVRSIKSETL